MIRTVLGWLLAATLALGGMPLTGHAQASTGFSLDAPARVQLGNPFTVELKADNVVDLYAFEVMFVYDADKLTFESARPSLQGSPGYAVGPLQEGDRITYAYTKLGDADMEDGNVTLGAFTFRAKQAGDAFVGIERVELADRQAQTRAYTVQQQITVSVERSNDSESSNDDDSDEPEEEDDQPDAQRIAIRPAIDGSARVTIEMTPDYVQGSAMAALTANDIRLALDLADPDAAGVRTLDVEIASLDDARRYALQLPASVLQAEHDDLILRMKSPIADIALPGRMLAGVELAGESHVEIVAGFADRERLPDNVRSQIGDRPVIELQIKAGDRIIPWRNPGAPVTVTMPYTPLAQERNDPEHIVVWYIDGEGNAVPVPSGRYDPAAGTVSFTTSHFSAFAPAFVKKTFGDLGSAAWARQPIEVLASKGIVSGTSAGTYAPLTNIARADFLALLDRTLELHAEFGANFDDVSPSDYYYDALGRARALGITVGVGRNLFQPQETITRQDMIVLAARALQLGKPLRGDAGSQEELAAFSDREAVADYAVAAIAALVDEGLIRGSDGRLNPRHTATRAEAAVLLYAIYNRQAK